MVRIGFLGGTGIEAEGLALRFASAGASVVLGSRSPARAAGAAEKCNLTMGQNLVRGMDNRGMIEASEIVFLTVPFIQAAEVMERYRSHLGPSHVLVDVTVPMVFRQDHMEYLHENEVSNSELLVSRLPDGVPLVAAFKTIPAAILANLRTALNCDVIVCGDVEDAKQKVMAAASMIPSLRALDGGPLRTARTLERMTVLAAELNRRYKKNGARYRLEGI